MTRRVLASVFFAAAAFVLLAKADGPNPPAKADAKPKTGQEDSKIDPKSSIDDLASKQVRMQVLFSDFKSALLRLSQRMAASPKPEDRERAKILKQALEKSNEEGIDNSFDKLVTILKTAKPDDQAAIEKAMSETEDLTKRLRAILALLMTDNRDAELRRQMEAAAKRIEELKRLIREQETQRTRTELGRGDKNDLGKGQNKITNDTEALAKGKGKGEGGEAGKAGSKPGDPKGEGKGGEGKGSGKEDTGDAKGGDKKPGGGEPKDGQKGEGKDGGKPNAGDPKKDGQKGEGKDGGKPSGGEPKDGQKGEGKDGGKEGSPGSKGGGKEGGKGDSKGKGDGKGDGKGGEGKGSDGQGGQGGGKSGGKGGQQAGGSKGGGQQGGDQKPKPDDPTPDFPGKKQIEDANDYQKKSEKDIDNGNNDAAADKQGKAVEEMKKAQKKLEDLLRQLREEEVERILAALQGRCEKMLAMQKDVREGTLGLKKVMEERGSPKIDPADAQRGNELSDKENAIVKEADIAIELLRGEGSAVAFPVVFDFVRDLMINVRGRLGRTDVGATTVATEDEIIASLEEMIDALKKARKANQGSGQPGGSSGGPPPNQPLLEEIQELKMIRNMQLRVNRMTETYGKEYKGEQPPAAEKVPASDREKVESLHKELKGLAERQEKIFEVTNNLYKGKNK